jgi:asparagine synthase (glutamine-hydrolysing)
VNDLDKLTYLYARLYLAEGVLQKVDRATMAYGLECRSPLLAPNVVRCAMSIPSGLKIRQKQSKWVLREALKSRLPKSILERPKKGFGMPLTAWLKGPLLPLCRELLTDPGLRDQALFKKEACEKLIDEHVKGFRDHRKTLWALMVYQLWEHNRP